MSLYMDPYVYPKNRCLIHKIHSFRNYIPHQYSSATIWRTLINNVTVAKSPKTKRWYLSLLKTNGYRTVTTRSEE